MARIRLHEIEPSHVEITDLTSICVIQCYKCSIKTYAVFEVWDTNSSFVENRSVHGGDAHGALEEDMLDVSLAPIYLYIYLQDLGIWIKFCN
jgi:hypothetical protein